ncbi:MAG: NUDIX domain-containing protein [Kiritimatiellae bacterium]|nr:NUDIX domain-containing protein [Kiritimatiellia bacterium]
MEMKSATGAQAGGIAPEEWFDVVDEAGRPVGRAPRRECHGNPALIHPAVHVFVFDSRGRLFLQRRSLTKDIQPGRWDTSVGGHLRPGEAPEAGAKREMMEELGVEAPLRFSHAYVWRSPVETEYVRSYVAQHEGPFRLDPAELAEGRFWTADEIARARGRGVFTPNFEHELEWLARDPAGALAALGVASGFARARGSRAGGDPPLV